MYKILLVPHPVLRQKSLKITKVTKEDLDLANQMITVMKNAPGVGLAANQIGVLKQIITVHIQDDEKKIDKVYSLFNPVITKFSKKKVIMEEGCLSLPQQFSEIERSADIKIKYLNESNKIIEEDKQGLEARILQHEIDHLYGKLFVDYLSSLKRNKLIKRVQKLKKLGEI
tara:strand:- start:374 stop:886 length:513 start_codon:yes stop_codon:yes gene_type:complete